jgi:hypothetical protein
VSRSGELDLHGAGGAGQSFIRTILGLSEDAVFEIGWTTRRVSFPESKGETKSFNKDKIVSQQH